MVNIDWSIHLRLRKNAHLAAIAQRLLRGDRRKAFEQLDENIIVHDLRTGIPASSSSVDAVYHSHIFEHIDRSAVPAFLGEVRRVLKPGGIHRIAVPDLEGRAREYLASLDRARSSFGERYRHDDYVGLMIEQMVRREASGTAQQGTVQRWIENRLLGDARKRGETHQWMWDEINLGVVLEQAGFTDVQSVTHISSAIPGWAEFGLDKTGDGTPYKPESLYIEARA